MKYEEAAMAGRREVRDNIYVEKKECPRCRSGAEDMWQAADNFLTCLVCHWWGWLR